MMMEKKKKNTEWRIERKEQRIGQYVYANTLLSIK